MIPAAKVIVRLLTTLDELGVRYAIGGSLASSTWGRPRQTEDADIAVLINGNQADVLIDRLKEEFSAAPSSFSRVAAARDDFPSIQFIHFDETFRIDVFLLESTEYVHEAFARRRPLPITAEYNAQFACAEDTVITKLRWFVLGNRVSDKQWNDIVQVLESQWTAFDFAFTRKWAAHFDVLPELEKAVADAKPS